MRDCNSNRRTGTAEGQEDNNSIIKYGFGTKKKTTMNT